MSFAARIESLLANPSTGGIIALGLGVKHWSVAECMMRFRDLCAQAFSPRPFKRLALISHKSLYKTTPLETALEGAFGSHGLLFGGRSDDQRGDIKVAVTSTSAVENRPVILTNYNVAGPERDNRQFSNPSP